MLNAKIFFFSLLTDITNIDDLSISINDDSTIRTLLELLSNKFGNKFDEIVFDTSSNLSKYLLISINGKDIRSLDGLDTKIKADDEISFIPAIAGG